MMPHIPPRLLPLLSTSSITNTVRRLLWRSTSRGSPKGSSRQPQLGLHQTPRSLLLLQKHHQAACQEAVAAVMTRRHGSSAAIRGARNASGRRAKRRQRAVRSIRRTRRAVDGRVPEHRKAESQRRRRLSRFGKERILGAHSTGTRIWI